MLFVAILSLGFVSCDDDDEDDKQPSTASIVGTWFMQDEYGDKTTIVFNSNGKGTFSEEYSDGSQYSEKFEYAYDASEKELVVVGTDVFDGTYYVVLTSTTLRLTDKYGDTEQFKRK